MAIKYFMALLLISTAYCQLFPRAREVANIADKISDLITANKETHEGVDAFPFIAGFVRIPFHDCAGDGNCDGCLELTKPDHTGLERYTTALDELYTDETINTKMTRADFYILAGYVALERGTEHTRDKFRWSDNFRLGRVSCANSPNEAEGDDPDFVGGLEDFSAAHAFFSDHFGFTQRDSVAIMGSHTLGRCSAENAGFEGKWVAGQSGSVFKSDMLNNEYFRQLRGNWTQFGVVSNNGATIRNQWQRPETAVPNNADQTDDEQPSMVLNVDMSVQWDIETFDTIDPDDGTVTCEVVVNGRNCFTDLCCDPAPTNTRRNSLFDRYVRDNKLWLNDFTSAFNKMVESNSGVSFQRPQ